MNQGQKRIKLLGIDYGTANIGLAISEGFLAQPLKTLKVKNSLEAIKRIQGIIKEKNIGEIILGISEKKMAQQTKRFAKVLKEVTQLPIAFCDETLTSQEAYQKMFESGKSRAKRKTDEHIVAACLILQEYIDSSKNSC